MKYHHAIRTQLEAEGFMVTASKSGNLFTVAASKDGKVHIVQTEDLTVSFLEVQRSIRGQETLAQGDLF